MLKQHLFRYQGHIGAYLVVAGVDPTGVGLFTVHAHGSTDKLPYVTMGSGSLAAMSVFETQWKSKMTQDEAVALASNAIQAGIFNDLGSGSNVDVAIITKDKTTLKRGFVKPNERSKKQKSYVFKRGTTAILNEKVITREEISKYVTVHELEGGETALGEKMDLDVWTIALEEVGQTLDQQLTSANRGAEFLCTISRMNANLTTLLKYDFQSDY